MANFFQFKNQISYSIQGYVSLSSYFNIFPMSNSNLFSIIFPIKSPCSFDNDSCTLIVSNFFFRSMNRNKTNQVNLKTLQRYCTRNLVSSILFSIVNSIRNQLLIENGDLLSNSQHSYRLLHLYTNCIENRIV